MTQLEKDKKAFAVAKRFKDAGRCQTELKENQAKIENMDLQLAKTLENKDSISKDMEDKSIEVENLENCLIEIRSRIEHNYIKNKLYRKSEIIDLITSISKLKDNPLLNELNMKKEKM